MNRVRVTVDDLRRAVDADVRRNWSDRQWMRWLDAAAVLHGQSFRNVVLIKLQMPDAMWVEGRQGWQRTGRRILRGASGIRIAGSTVDTQRAAGPVQGHGVATVWDVSQTDGPSIALPAVGAGANGAAQDVFAALAQVAAAAGYSVEPGRLMADSSGAEIDHRRRRIVVGDDPASLMGLAHELAHLRMHKVSRDAQCHGLIRLEAQSVAYALLARFGCLPNAPSAALLTSAVGVIGRNPSVRLVETLGGRVVATSKRLIGAAERYMPMATDALANGRGIRSHTATINSLEAGSAGPEFGL